MKVYITANSNTGRQLYSDWLQGFLDAQKKDIKLLAKCDTLEDVENTEWNCYNYPYFIRTLMENGETSIEEAIDAQLEDAYENLQNIRKDLKHHLEYEANARNLLPKLKSTLSAKYDLVKSEGIGEKLIFNPPEGATHDDCIAFVDDVVSAIDGEYIYTGRGSSWTVWSVISSSGIQFKAGWYGRSNQWYVEVQLFYK